MSNLKEPIPIILITGYLGAGKTTLLNHLLGLNSIRSQNPALIINEFGSLGVDGSLIAPGDWTIFELNKGSIFCICLKTDFLQTLETIALQTRPGLLIVEATGVAETRDLLTMAEDPSLKNAFQVRGNICIVDALNFIKVAPMLKAAREQVMRADALIINKSDLVPEEELSRLREVLHSLNAGAPMAAVQYGRIDEDFIHTLRHHPRGGELITEPPAPLFSLSIERRNRVNRGMFLKIMEEFRHNILRLKGRVDFGDGPRFCEVVCDRFTERPDTSGRAGTAFVVIAWNMRQTQLEQALESVFED